MIEKSISSGIREKLLEGKLSQRKIALLFGVSRSAVRAILESIHRKPQRKSGVIHPSGKYGRCPHCGALVQKPCLACQLRGFIRHCDH
ncbi:MAG: hypothetical protein ACRCUY_12105 [Thermoguttaceae bacterium]